MRIMRLRLVLVALLATLGSCHDPVGPDICPQTSEFGNYGCASVVVVVPPPSGSLPNSRRLTIIVRPLRETGSLAIIPQSPFGAIPVHLTRWLPDAGDTVSAWVVAKALDQSNPVIGEPLPVIAADSVVHLLRFAAVNELRMVDTVPLVLQRVP